jgi:hypothetical protein
MPRKVKQGGTRQGQPGKNYPNRTDMQQGPRQRTQPVRAAAGQQYGQRGQQENMQRAQPLPQGPQIIPLDAPTLRPNEPLTAGMAMGPGPGPEALPQGGVTPDMDAEAFFRALYRQFPNTDIARILASIDAKRMAAPRNPTPAPPGGRLGAPAKPGQTISRENLPTAPPSIRNMGGGMRVDPNAQLDGSQVVDMRRGGVARAQVASANPSDAGNSIINVPNRGDDTDRGA